MKNINIQVSDQAAERFSNMTKPEKDTFSRFIDEIIEDKRTLWEVMEDMSEYAKKQGLTQEKLNNILNDESE